MGVGEGEGERWGGPKGREQVGRNRPDAQGERQAGQGEGGKAVSGKARG